MWMERHDLSLLSHLRSSTIGLADRRSPFNGTAFSSLGTSTVREGFNLSPIPTTLLEPWVMAKGPLAYHQQRTWASAPPTCVLLPTVPAARAPLLRSLLGQPGLYRPCGHCLEPTVGPFSGALSFHLPMPVVASTPSAPAIFYFFLHSPALQRRDNYICLSSQGKG